MRVDELAPAPGSTHPKKRLGRGIGGKGGKTAGRGTKGQHSRGRGKVARGFEGGQMPLFRRLPKKGFSNVQFRDVYEVVNVGCLNDAFEDGAVINEASLRESGLVNRNCDAIKILGSGDLSRKLTIEIKNVSASAREKIEKAGGSVAA